MLEILSFSVTMALRLAARRSGARLHSAAPRATVAAPIGHHQHKAAVLLRSSPAAASLSGAASRRWLSTAPEKLVGAEPAPTPKQLQFAHDLAGQHNTPMPEEAKSSAIVCSAFIESVLESNPNPPTDKQLAFLTRLCAERGQEVPPEALADRRKCSAVLDELLGNTPEGGAEGAASSTEPSDKQILYAARLARGKGMGISADALASKTAMSALIEQLSGAAGGAAGGGGGGGGYSAPSAPSGVDQMGWQPTAPHTSAFPPPLEQRDQENKGRYPY
eukprot:COSAG06_NODE_1240_length_10123_cov_19.440343_4_plen_276_part_00